VKDVSSYDFEPVSYCSKCYSLRVGYIEGIDNSDYCLNCGSTDIAKAPIGEWEKLYKDRYGRKFIERIRDPEKVRIQHLSWQDLKEEFYTGKYYKDIIREMYPRFPKYKSKEDEVIAFLNRIIEDNKIDELRDWIYIKSKNIPIYKSLH